MTGRRRPDDHEESGGTAPATPVDAGEEQWPHDWGLLLRLARQVAGFSLTELSAQTGLSKGYLSKLESGHASARNPSRATLAALARALPSFRPLAHTLEPSAPLGALALAEVAPTLPQLVPAEGGGLADSPVTLGWREMELLVAVLALEHAALPQPTNAVLLARAVGRSLADATATLDRLAAMGVLERAVGARRGMPAEYRPGARFEALTGLRRLGDALVLAAALLAQSPTPPRRGRSAGSEGE